MSVRRETFRMPIMILFQPLLGAFPGQFAAAAQELQILLMGSCICIASPPGHGYRLG